MEKSDNEIIQKAKINPRIFEEIYKKYADKVYRYFWYRTGHQKDTAEDLTQETFLRAFKHLAHFQNRGYSYLSYLLAIAHNVLANYYRSHKMIPLSAFEGIDIPFPEEITSYLEKKITIEQLQKALNTLSAAEKEITLMRYRDEMSIKEISKITGKSENAVKLILSRARKKLISHSYLQNLLSR